MTRNSLVAIIAAMVLSGCSSPADEANEEGIEAIQKADALLSRAVDAKDIGKIASFYANDAILMPAAEPLIQGRAAITEEWEHILSIPDFRNTSTLTRTEASAGNDLAYTMGTYESQMMGEDGKPVTEPGKWLTVWKKQADGTWRIVVETYNTDIPPPDHK